MDGTTPLHAATAIYRQLSAARQRQLGLTVLLMIAGAFAELATIGAVLPFLAIAAPSTGGSRYAGAIEAVGDAAVALGTSPVALSAALLIVIAILSAIIRLTLVWISQNLVFAIAHDLATTIYDRTLHQPYGYHIMRNSSETLSGIDKVQYVLGNVLLPAMAGTTAAVVAVFIMAALIAVDPATALLACACFVALYAIVSLVTRARLYHNADVIADALQARIQTLQEGLGGIRDVLLDRSQPIFLAKFARIDDRFRRAQAANQFIAAAPRYVVEAGGVILIAILTVYVAGRAGGVIGALPMLGALALGAQRLLPQVQQVYFSWSQIHGNRGTLSDVARLLDMPLPVDAPAGIRHDLTTAVTFDAVSFRYAAADRLALADISLTIPKGARIGLVGKSGSGKSTLVDLLMGLMEPSEGTLRIDGEALDARTSAAWQAGIAHVPQALFLFDGSIAANIAFGVEAADIDMARVAVAAQQAELHDHIAALPAGYDTVVGERGVRLSGGQRQRIGIARALYKRATVLILDEATSALDEDTETSVMAAIARLPRSLTIVSIAHRVSTLRMCDTVVRLDQGRIVAVGPYDRVMVQARAEA